MTELQSKSTDNFLLTRKHQQSYTTARVNTALLPNIRRIFTNRLISSNSVNVQRPMADQKKFKYSRSTTKSSGPGCGCRDN